MSIGRTSSYQQSMYQMSMRTNQWQPCVCSIGLQPRARPSCLIVEQERLEHRDNPLDGTKKRVRSTDNLSIQIPYLAPGFDSGVERILSLQLSVICSFGILVSSRASGSTKSRLTRSASLARSTLGRVRSVVTCKLCSVLACNGYKLISLATLGDFDSVLVGPFLDFCPDALARTARRVNFAGKTYESQTKSREERR
jgi:hypothetical protein